MDPLNLIATIVICCVFGLLFALFGKKNSEKQIPFGPSIAAAAGVMLLYGNGAVNWYLGLFGAS